MPSAKTENNEVAWQELFEKYSILNHIKTDGFYRISAAEIKEFREPRLMTKFDHSSNLPLIFSNNNLSILPLSRSEYSISHFKAYHTFESVTSDIQTFPPPDFLESLNPMNISSESMALNYALAAGIITDFLEESEVVPTVSGRMGSGSFSFAIDCPQPSRRRNLHIQNAQIEIDGAYEGANSLALFEAKRDLSDDFLVRQLYYPYRTWCDRLNKKIRSVFMVYSNSIYRLLEYEFAEKNYYNSLHIVKHKNYAIESIAISIKDIEDLLAQIHICDEPAIAFPQADKFDRIINLCELLKERTLNKYQITEQYEFNIRQTRYYTDAGIYLGLIEKYSDNHTTTYRLTNMCEGILKKNFKQRQLAFCSCILSHKIFNEVLRLTLLGGEIPEKSTIVSIMKTNRPFHMESDSTFERRSATVRAWIQWIITLTVE